MEDSRRHAVVRLLLLGVVTLVGAVLAVVTVAARSIVVPPRSRDEDIEVLAVDHAAGTITLSLSPDSINPGKYTFWFSKDRGRARVGEILSEDGSSVTRELLAIDYGDIDSARRGRINGWFYVDPGDLGADFENVTIDTELGPAPAWLVPAPPTQPGPVKDSGRWVIQIHGRAVVRAETLRAIPVFRNAGYTSLLISYRNDTEAPDSEDGRYALGDVEWRDVDAALRYALDHGARSIVLMGWSMGGATALQALTRSPFAAAISGIVLDSPVVDWVSALEFQARSKGIIPPLRRLVYAVLGSRWGRVVTGQQEPINLARLDFVSRAGDLHVPILILHSDDDAYVPSDASRALAAARPDTVTLVSFQGARHTKLWNREPDLWNRSIATWLEEIRDHAVSG